MKHLPLYSVILFILCCCNLRYHITKPAQIHKTLSGERKAEQTDKYISAVPDTKEFINV